MPEAPGFAAGRDARKARIGVGYRRGMTEPSLRRRELVAVVLLMALASAGLALAASSDRAPALLISGLLANLVAFAYMARLLAVARRRTRQYAALSWGVLSGLLRTLDARDGRAARHAAAVATFAHDIAREAGMGARDCELAHTAGLLHDIGRFALPDRLGDRDARLSPEDWEEIGRHPEVGAALLADLGLYGPVAEIVAAHHERIDGRGYPNGLRGDAIPALARVVAVAEVYDTLTAPDTYRTPISSFEALRELRRVAGTQLDPRYVEALAVLLAGRAPSTGTPTTPTSIARSRSSGESATRWRLGRASARHRADVGLVLVLDLTLLERGDELVDLLRAEAALAARRAVGTQIAHVRPPADGPEGHAELAGNL